MKRISYIIPIILYLLFAFSCTRIIKAASTDENIYSFIWDGRTGDFIGALNTKLAPNLLRKDQSPQITNFATDDKLGLVKRDSYSFIDSLPVSTTTKILNTHVLVKDDGSSFLLVHVGSSVYSTSQLGTSWTLIKTGLSSKYPVRFATHYNKTFCSNGINTVFSTDGFTSTEYSFIPKAFYPLSADGRLWMGSTVDNPSFVYFSEINVDPITSSDWDIAENAQEFGIGDGQIIKGLDYQKGIIWPYKERSSYGIRSIVNKYLALSDYGTVSQFSINGYGNGKIFLDKSGFYYFAGGNVTYLSSNIDNLVEGIGLISASENRISITSNTDFSTGTFSGCYNNSGTVEISSQTKEWTTTADFANGGAGTTQVDTSNNEVKINTSTAGGYAKLSLGGDTNSGGLDTYHSGLTMVGDQYPAGSILATGNGNGNSELDSSDDTFFGGIYTVKNLEIWNTVRSTDAAFVTMPITKVRIKYKHARYFQSQAGPTRQFLLYITNPAAEVLNGGVRLLDSNFGHLTDVLTFDKGAYPGYTGTDPQIFDKTVTFATPQSTAKIQIYYSVVVPFQSLSGGTVSPALLVYDISAWSGGGNAVLYSSGVYSTPPYDSGQTTTQYQKLKTSDYLAHTSATSSDTIKYWARTATASGDLATATSYYLGLSSGGYNEYALPDGLDSKQWFQCLAEIESSSITATPVIYDATLQFATTNYATYTSKVFSVSKKITSWGSFVTDDEGTVTYEIRGTTWNFGGGETILSGSNSTQWTAITNGSDISLSTNNVYVQVKPYLHTKNSKVLGINLTYSENPNSSGGLQEVSSMSKDNRYLFACSTWTTNNDVVFVFNQNKAWEMWDNYPVASFVKFNNNYYFASSTQPIICKMYDGNSSVDAIWKSPHTDFGMPEKDKKLRNAYITTEPKTGSFCYLEYGCDFSTFTVKTFVDLSSNLSRTKLVELQDGYFGQNFYFTISSTSTAKPEIQALKIEYQIYNR